MFKQIFQIKNAEKFEGQTVTAQGWVYQSRSSGKIKFLILRDGTGLMQCVLFKGECQEAAFLDFDKITQESAVEVSGKIKKEPRSPGGYEMGVQTLK
ncbi:MAG: asparagine--tRNA ligase, partial [Deltaproteobacteria bacterium]|nr:asparagine--tRNA ligase [Deltaproteobacteria bacterium]